MITNEDRIQWSKYVLATGLCGREHILDWGLEPNLEIEQATMTLLLGYYLEHGSLKI